MSNIQSTIIQNQAAVMSDMSTIIGRYKGFTEAMMHQIIAIAERDSTVASDLGLKSQLLNIAKRMQRIVNENEELWDNRGKREATDIVELERA